MPRGCEEKFKDNWDRNDTVDHLEEGKYLYGKDAINFVPKKIFALHIISIVIFAIKTAIFDAYKNKEDLQGSVLYVTLYPSNTCAQCIREAGIGEVVYADDNNRKINFVEASKRILEGIKCR